VYALYRKSRKGELTSFQFVEECSLFGCNEGFIPWLLAKRIPANQNEPYKWYLPIGEALNATEYRDSTLVIDLKPKQQKTNLSLYEVLDVWGYSDAGWTPILLHLSGLFVDSDPTEVNRKVFAVPDAERQEPIYEFLYLNGGISTGRLSGPWNAPPASPTNGALLWPETLNFFIRCIRERTPRVLD
jgi:hypothetical protein